MKLEIKVLNSMRLTKLLIAASRWLSKYADVLNDLNVYPVPDGDTGTNMSMTLQAVENELIKLNHEPKMKELVEIVSEAILLGARGNSGTILSQIIQGFLSSIEDKEEITVDDVIKAFGMAKERAYQAVSEPVEGTMLTVIRRVAEEAAVYQGDRDDFILFLVHLKNVAKEAVEETPNLLPKLKEAGVVDAGGKGIFYVLEGFEKSVTDPEMLKDLERIVQSQAKRKERMEYSYHTTEEIKYRYCTEFIIEEGNFDLEGYKKEIMSYGDSMVCAQTTHKTKTHIHTNNPGQVLEIAIKYGQLNNIKIENMAFQHKNLLLKENHTNKNLQADYNLFGITAFQFEIIDIVDKNQAEQIETYWINYYGGIESDNTYNMTNLFTCNNQVKESISKANVGNIRTQDMKQKEASSKLKLYQTSAGVKIKQQISKSLKSYYNSDKGIKQRKN